MTNASSFVRTKAKLVLVSKFPVGGARAVNLNTLANGLYAECMKNACTKTLASLLLLMMMLIFHPELP
jgi:hypothetical protein